MNYKIEKTEIQNNLDVLEGYYQFISKFKKDDELLKDANITYLQNIKKVTNQTKISELTELCKSLQLSEQNINIILNMGKFFKYEDLIENENIAESSLEPIFTFLNKYF